MEYFKYDLDSFIPCEICDKRAIDVHHIENRKSGGDPTGNKDKIENLMGLCRTCHFDYGDVPGYKDHLKAIHLSRMNTTNL